MLSPYFQTGEYLCPVHSMTRSDWHVRTGESRGEFDEFRAGGQIEPAASTAARESLPDGTIKLWAITGVFLDNLKNLRNDSVPMNSVALSQNNKFVVASLLDQIIRLRDKVTRLPTCEIFVGVQVRANTFSSSAEKSDTVRRRLDAEALPVSHASTRSQSLCATQYFPNLRCQIDSIAACYSFSAVRVNVYSVSGFHSSPPLIRASLLSTISLASTMIACE
jgi:WD40 repeat protein